MTRGDGKRNARRLAARTLRHRGGVSLNRAERRAAARGVKRRLAPDHAAGELKGKKARGSTIRDVRRAYAGALRQRDEDLAETRAQIVDPETGLTVEEEKKSRLWRPRRLWTPGKRRR